MELVKAAKADGLAIRAGVHTGEVEVIGDDVRGIAVHEASRVMAQAGPGEIMVSALTRQLVGEFGDLVEDRGERELRGLDGPRRLFAVVT